MLSIREKKNYDLLGWTIYFDKNNSPCYDKLYIHVEAGIIKKMYKTDMGYKPPGMVYELSDGYTIFPGLIDLHTHYEYNTIPIWKRPYDQPWDNRHEWRMHSEYDKYIKNLYKELLNHWTSICLSKEDNVELAKRKFLFLSEIQALAGGTTVLQEPFDIGDEGEPIATPHTLLRSTGVASDLGLKKQTYSIIDFYKPDIAKSDIKPNIDTSDWNIKFTNEYEDFLLNLIDTPNTDVNAYLVHLAEGRAGVLKPGNLSVDSYTKKEADRIMRVLSRCDANRAKQIKLTLIHGCGLDVLEYKKLISQTDVGVVWSPVSNLLLYDDTPDFYKYYKEGIINRVAIGSDWSPSGSKHVWDEAKFAYRYLCNRFKGVYTKQDMAIDILKMCTIYSANILGTDQIGNIKEGGFADFLIVNTGPRYNADEEWANVASAFFEVTDNETHAVIVDGKVVYGDKEVFEKFGEAYEFLPDSEQPETSSKAVLSMQNVYGCTLNDMIDDLNKSFLDYSEEAHVTIAKSKLLSSNDSPYRLSIKQLEQKFC